MQSFKNNTCKATNLSLFSSSCSLLYFSWLSLLDICDQALDTNEVTMHLDFYLQMEAGVVLIPRLVKVILSAFPPNGNGLLSLQYLKLVRVQLLEDAFSFLLLFGS